MSKVMIFKNCNVSPVVVVELGKVVFVGWG
jgi:hypothetical protein